MLKFQIKLLIETNIFVLHYCLFVSLLPVTGGLLSCLLFDDFDYLICFNCGKWHYSSRWILRAILGFSLSVVRITFSAWFNQQISFIYGVKVLLVIFMICNFLVATDVLVIIVFENICLMSFYMLQVREHWWRTSNSPVCCNIILQRATFW